MKKWRIEYNQSYTPTPMSFWVHEHVAGEIWSSAGEYVPALPKAIPCKGYPMLIVSVLGVELKFASVAEVEHFISVLSQKNLPTTLQLSRLRIENYGPNNHWLSRLPASLKPWSKRERLLPILKLACEEYRQICVL